MPGPAYRPAVHGGPRTDRLLAVVVALLAVAFLTGLLLAHLP